MLCYLCPDEGRLDSNFGGRGWISWVIGNMRSCSVKWNCRCWFCGCTYVRSGSLVSGAGDTSPGMSVSHASDLSLSRPSSFFARSFCLSQTQLSFSQLQARWTSVAQSSEVASTQRLSMSPQCAVSHTFVLLSLKTDSYPFFPFTASS